MTETVWRIWKARTNSSPCSLRMGGPLRRLLGKGAVRWLHVGDGSRTHGLVSPSEFDFGCATVKGGPINALRCQSRVEPTRICLNCATSALRPLWLGSSAPFQPCELELY
jgi:hypothetical protein